MSGRLLPLEIGLLLVSISNLIRSSFGQITNENASCIGDLDALNFKGNSPCSVYKTLQQPCSPGSIGLNQTACTCNIIAYNLGNACLSCGNKSMQSWRAWAQEFDCVQNSIPDKLVYTPPSESNIPKWAHQMLISPDATFDVATAIQSTKPGWTPVQIALPIISAVAALLVAALVFYCYRRRKSRPQTRRYWQDANLQGPRRFFGLVPDILRVRKETVDTLWEIDDRTTRNDAFTPPATTQTYHSQALQDASHSRTTSLSSLLPTTSNTPSDHSNTSSSSGLGNFISKFSWSSHSGGRGKAKYKKGVAKAPEYKRVNVTPDKPSARFKIDEPETASPLRTSFLSRIIPGDRRSNISRAPTIPSVLDIRLGTPAELEGRASSDSATVSAEGARGRDRGRARGVTRMPVLYGAVEEDDEGDDESVGFPKPPRSEFTLTTDDLMTPTDVVYTNAPGLRPPSPSISTRADSAILPSMPAASSPLRASHSAPQLKVPPPGKPKRR